MKSRYFMVFFGFGQRDYFQIFPHLRDNFFGLRNIKERVNIQELGNPCVLSDCFKGHPDQELARTCCPHWLV